MKTRKLLTYLCIFVPLLFMYVGLAWSDEHKVECSVVIDKLNNGEPYVFSYHFKYNGKDEKPDFTMLQLPDSWSEPNPVVIDHKTGELIGFTMTMNDISEPKKQRFLQFKFSDRLWRGIGSNVVGIKVVTQDLINGVLSQKATLSSTYSVNKGKSFCNVNRNGQIKTLYVSSI